MSVSAITSNLLHQQQTQALQSRRSGFADLASALASSPSNSSSAGSLLSLLSGTSLSSSSGTSASGAASSTSGPPSAQSILMGELTALGAQLQAGNLSSAQQAYNAFTKDLSATGSQGPTRILGHGSHPRPIYSGDAGNLTTTNSASSNPLSQPAVLA